jgi:hypothetical protein
MILMLKILKFGIQRIPPKQVLAKNGEMKVLISELHRKMNLLSFLFSILGPETKLQSDILPYAVNEWYSGSILPFLRVGFLASAEKLP